MAIQTYNDDNAATFLRSVGSPARGEMLLAEDAVSGGAWTEERTRVAVGRNVNVSGKLIFHEPVRIEGRFRGEVRSAELVVVAEGGMIEGKVFAPRLYVMGELRGAVTGCERVALGPRSRVYGNIETANLSVNEGAYLEGFVRVTGISAVHRNSETLGK